MPETNNPLHYIAPKRLRLIGYIAGGIAILIVAVGLVTRVMASREVDNWTQDNALPTVSVINLANSKSGSLVLPGNVQAFNSAPIYAQITGYVQKWYVDIGTPVKAGQLLAQIDPRTYQAAVDQAKGALARDQASLGEAKLDLTRFTALAAQHAISDQQLSSQKALVASDVGIVALDEANLKAAQINLNYTRIVAPFDGTLTSRSIDIGNYVAAGNGSATPLFTVADDTKVRIYVSVPQNSSSQLKPGMAAKFTVPQHPGQVFVAALAASADSVNTQTGTVLVQLLADNPGDLFNPGDYAQVTFDLPADKSAIRLPASALIFGDNGTAIAVVGPRNRVVLKPVTILRDYGTAVEIAAGLSPSDRVIDNPPDSLRPGDEVRLATATPAAP
ncbi:MAG: efflux RND transporter periplasmic adaptor subunit [Rhizomicrobium sp.]